MRKKHFDQWIMYYEIHKRYLEESRGIYTGISERMIREDIRVMRSDILGLKNLTASCGDSLAPFRLMLLYKRNIMLFN